MLDVRHAPTIIDDLWETVPRRAALPCGAAEFFSQTGPAPSHFECRRGYRRFFLRAKAILLCGDQMHAGYMADISRNGVGIVSPVQWFPCQQIDVWLSDNRQFVLRIDRCRHVSARCYECGATFVV